MGLPRLISFWRLRDPVIPQPMMQRLLLRFDPLEYSFSCWVITARTRAKIPSLQCLVKNIRYIFLIMLNGCDFLPSPLNPSFSIINSICLFWLKERATNHNLLISPSELVSTVSKIIFFITGSFN